MLDRCKLPTRHLPANVETLAESFGARALNARLSNPAILRTCLTQRTCPRRGVSIHQLLVRWASAHLSHYERNRLSWQQQRQNTDMLTPRSEIFLNTLDFGSEAILDMLDLGMKRFVA